MRSRGSVEMAAKAKMRGRELAEKLGTSASMISLWGSGKRVPSAVKRELIAAHLGIEISAWDSILPDENSSHSHTAVRNPVISHTAATPDTTLQMAEELAGIAKALITDLKETGIGDSDAAMRKASEISRVLASLGKITGASITNERQIVRTPAWARIREVIVDSLADYPAALESVVEALEALEVAE